MSLLKKLASETAIYGLSSIGGRLVTWLLVSIYTRTLLKSEYGVVSDLYATSAFLIVIFSYRMESAFFRFGTPEEDRDRSYSTALQSLLFSTLLITLLIMVFAQPIATLALYPQHADYIRYFGLIMAFDCLAELPFARLRLEQRPRRFVTIKLTNMALYIGFNLFWLVFCPWAAKNGQAWVHAVWQPAVGVTYIFISNLIASVVTLLLLLPQLRAAFREHFDKILWVQMLKYAGPLIIVGFAGIVNETFDRAALKYLLPGALDERLAEVGVYGANYKLAMMITLFTQAYRYAAEPFFFRNAGNTDAMRVQANATKWFTIVAAAGMLGILLYLDVIKYFLGQNFHSGLQVVPILLLANLFLGIYYNVSVWYRLKDRTMTGAWISIVGALLTLVLNIWWIPKIGYMGSAWATLICYAFMVWATWLIGRKYYPVPYPILRMALYIGAVLALYGISLLVRQNLATSPLVWVVNTILFGLFLALVYSLEKEQLRKISG